MNSAPRRPHGGKAKIWIDLDNSPHVPFFAPIIDELQNRGYSIMLTARNAYQVRELADLFHLKYKLIGHHQGKNKLRKLFGVGVRGMQLIPTVLREKPDLAISHGSRSQIMVCAGLRIPSLLILDYECAKRLGLIEPTWYMCPEVIPSSVFRCDPKRVLKYPGIKEDVYVPRFVPDPHIRPELGLDNDDVVVTVRPPATEAHYHRPQSDELFEAVIEFLSRRPEVKIVMLPRNEKQAAHLRNHWPGFFRESEDTHPTPGRRRFESDLALRSGDQWGRYDEPRGRCPGRARLQHLSREDWRSGPISQRPGPLGTPRRRPGRANENPHRPAEHIFQAAKWQQWRSKKYRRSSCSHGRIELSRALP